MAQNYADGLQRSPRPNRIPRDGDKPNADMVERERGARELDALEGRFGRFVDSGGNWATAWQAPPVGQPIGPTPAFVAPGRIVKFRTGEMALQSAASDDPDQPTESTLVAPGQWVVRYDGDEEAAIVVNDEAFRGEMRSEEQARAEEAATEPPRGPAIASEAPAASSGAGETRNAPTGTPEAPASMVHLMVDHFVKLVMSDNNRLRHELSDAQVIIGGLKQGNARNYEERQRLEAELAHWRREHDELAQRVRDGTVPMPPPPPMEYDPPDPTPVDVPPELSTSEILDLPSYKGTPIREVDEIKPDPVEAALATAPPRVAATKRKG